MTDGILTPLQREFLKVRATTNTDKAAADAVGVAAGTPWYWKKNKIAFREAYESANFESTGIGRPAGEPEKTEIVVPLLDDALDVRTYIENQLDDHVGLLEIAFQRLVTIIAMGTDSQALKAIEMLGRWYGIGPDSMKPPDLTVVQQNILQMFGGKSDDADSYDSETSIEAAFREMSPDE